jgi:sec-independent protein translocase protein TatB
MGFLDIGMAEILLILIVALIIWGPRRIPEIAKTLGRMMHNLRKATTDLTREVTKEIDIEEKDSLLQPRENRGDITKESSDVDLAGQQDRGTQPRAR